MIYKCLFDATAYRFFDGKKIAIETRPIQVDSDSVARAYAEASVIVYESASGEPLKRQEASEGRSLSIDGIDLFLVRCGDASR